MESYQLTLLHIYTRRPFRESLSRYRSLQLDRDADSALRIGKTWVGIRDLGGPSA